MLARPFRLWPGFLILGGGLLLLPALRGQDAAPDNAPPPVPKGIEVLARGPVHEAFASLTAEPQPTKAVAKKPPKPHRGDAARRETRGRRPSGSAATGPGTTTAATSSGSRGVWRTPPPGKQWVAGYWRDEGDGAQWVPGFWSPSRAKEDAPQDVTYFPKPPDPPARRRAGDAALGRHASTSPATGTGTAPTTPGAPATGRASSPTTSGCPPTTAGRPAGYIYIAGYWDSPSSAAASCTPRSSSIPTSSMRRYVYTPAYAVDDTRRRGRPVRAALHLPLLLRRLLR